MLVVEVSVGSWMWIAASFGLGALLGVVVTLLLRRSTDVEQRMRRLQHEFDQYQSEVRQHFSQTAEVLTRLRSDFAQLYQHTERGAADLVGEESVQRRLRELEIGDGRKATPVPEHRHDRPRAPVTLPAPKGQGPHAEGGDRVASAPNDDEAGDTASRG